MSKMAAYVTWHEITYGVNPAELQTGPEHFPHMKEYLAFKKTSTARNIVEETLEIIHNQEKIHMH